MKPSFPHDVPQRLAIGLLALGGALSCAEGERDDGATALNCEAPEMRETAERFGERMQRVSLQAPDSIREREMRVAYESLVSDELLDSWIQDPGNAPGRKVSSPWPARLEIEEIGETDSAACRVDGDVIHVTSAEADQGGVAQRERVSLLLRAAEGGWRIVAYRTGDSPSGSQTDNH
jgi:hypothetical protein